LGETPFSKFYPPGTYPVKVQKEGYVPIEGQTLTVTSPETRKKFTLAENVGYLTINTYETAKVFINGTEYTEHTNLKLPAQVVDIKITMPKAADLEKQVILKRNDHLTLDLRPEVQTGTIQVAVTPFEANIELTGDAGEHYTAQGMHIFRDIPVGEYTLTAKAKGYRTTTKTLTLNANGVLDENIKLEKGPSGDIEMVFVKGGQFQMGCTSEQTDCDSDEKPVHTVTVDDFYIGKYEITQKQWRDVMGKNPSGFSGCDDCPVERVSWNDIQEFIKKLNEKTGLHYRLPTEAEWEYAARGGTKSNGYKYSGNNNIDDVAWYSGNSGIKTHPVGQKKPNELGIYDMSGNVWEWCNDWYGSYSSVRQNNPQGSSSGSFRVFRGGSWSSYARYCRVAFRSDLTPDDRYYRHGFRLVLLP
jgi:formylglycine-generating enzyme required for sulfatase activity